MKNKICDKGLSFQDCELAILRTVVDKAEEKIGKASVNSPEIKRMIEIVENFRNTNYKIILIKWAGNFHIFINKSTWSPEP